MTLPINEIVSKIEDWKGKDISIQPLSGGLTNTNYKVEVDGTSFFVRVPGERTELLAIDRNNEYHNTKAAAETGVGPKVLYHLPEYNVMVLEFINGKTMSKEFLNAPGMPMRMAQVIKRLHAGPRFLIGFQHVSPDRILPVEFVPDIKSRFRMGYLERMSSVAQIEKALLGVSSSYVPCNNDLLAENYIDDGISLRLIDYEYSGNNDPCFELGNTCQEMQFNDEQIQRSVRCIFRNSFSE